MLDTLKFQHDIVRNQVNTDKDLEKADSTFENYVRWGRALQAYMLLTQQSTPKEYLLVSDEAGQVSIYSLRGQPAWIVGSGVS